MFCPKCAAKMGVEGTTNIPNVYGLTFRYRLCPDCGYLVETSEEVSREIRGGLLPVPEEKMKCE